MTASALLDHFDVLRKKNMLSDIDVELCRFFSELEPQVNAEILLAAALTSAAYREGNVCINLRDFADRPLFNEADGFLQVEAPALKVWVGMLNNSPFVGSPGEFKPLILDSSHRLYLQRHWKNEKRLAEHILKKAGQPTEKVDIKLLRQGLNCYFGKSREAVDWQKVAAALAVLNSFAVISGGPGTGKTTTVVRVLGLLLEQANQRGRNFSITLAAPTGKAAARLESSIQNALQDLPTSNVIKDKIPVKCHTIHQLLGARLHSSTFKFNKNNPLPYDYIIIDEVSMVDQALMSRFMSATMKKTQVLLLGDKDQLASVEAGSVLGDICGARNSNRFSRAMEEQLENLEISLPENNKVKNPDPLTDHIVLLQKSYRFEADSGIARLAEAVNSGEGERSLHILQNRSYTDVDLKTPLTYSVFLDELIDRAVTQIQEGAQAASPAVAFTIYRKMQILSPHRQGPWGVEFLNKKIEERLEMMGLKSPYVDWYRGKPIIINENNYRLGLSNGDTGIFWPDDEGNGRIYFEINNEIMGLWPSQLPAYSTAFVLTVHKSQGAEYNEVILVFPNEKSKILSRELLYTALTRAKKSVLLFAKKSVLLKTVAHKIARNSGLKDYLGATENI